jgi:hypothetical protein
MKLSVLINVRITSALMLSARVVGCRKWANPVLKRAGSQSYPSPAAKASADGSTTVYFGPTKPEGVSDGNWIQTDPKKGWFTILRLYSPLESFFAKKWRPSEIELVK